MANPRFWKLCIKPKAELNWLLGTTSEAMGHKEAYKSDKDAPRISTGTNEFKKVNINRTWEINAKTTDKITQNKLYPVTSTILPNIGDVTTVTKKNKLSKLKSQS